MDSVPLEDTPNRLARLIEQLTIRPKPLWFQVEHTSLRFRSRLRPDSGQLRIAAPAWARGELTPGSWLRMELPSLEGARAIRLRVLVPDAVPGSDPVVTLCALPEGAVQEHREHQRFAVSPDTSLLLEMNRHRYRVVDLSLTGLRLRLNAAQAVDPIPLGVPVSPAHLLLGGEVWVRFSQLIPRTHRGRLVGCAFRISSDGVSPHNLSALLDSLRHRALVSLPDQMATPAPHWTPQAMAGG